MKRKSPTPPLTPQESLELEQSLRRRAESQPGLAPEQRSETLRHANNLNASRRAKAARKAAKQD